MYSLFSLTSYLQKFCQDILNLEVKEVDNVSALQVRASNVVMFDFETIHLVVMRSKQPRLKVRLLFVSAR